MTQPTHSHLWSPSLIMLGYTALLTLSLFLTQGEAAKTLLCRCQADWENLYRRQTYSVDYKKVEQDDDGIYIIDGLKVLPDSFVRCRQKDKPNYGKTSLFHLRWRFGYRRRLRGHSFEEPLVNATMDRALHGDLPDVFPCPPRYQGTDDTPKTVPTTEPTARLETAEPTVSPTVVSLEPSQSAEPSASPSVSMEPSTAPSLSFEPTVSSEPSSPPTLAPTPHPTPIPTPRPSPSPTPRPTVPNDPRTTSRPTSKPTPRPTSRPTSRPTPRPTPQPSSRPTPRPSRRPTRRPRDPTDSPTEEPTLVPTEEPTKTPKPSLEGDWRLQAARYGNQVNDQAGRAVAYTNSGQYMAAGYPGQDSRRGRVDVYELLNGNEWRKIGKSIKGSNDGDQFGRAVALNEDASIVVVGAYKAENRRGWVTVFQYSTSSQQWRQLGQTIYGNKENDDHGFSVAASKDGYTIAIGAPNLQGDNTGFCVAYSYSSSDKEWLRVGTKHRTSDNGDLMGYSVDISEDGKTMACGAPGSDYSDGGRKQRRLAQKTDAGRVVVYEYRNSDWYVIGQELVGDVTLAQAGTAVSLNGKGTMVAYSMPGMDVGGVKEAGTVRVMVYYASVDRWYQVGDDVVGDVEGAEIGQSLALNPSGDALVYNSGAYNELRDGAAGYAIMRSWNGFDWALWGNPLQLTGTDKYSAVAINEDGDAMLVGYEKPDGKGAIGSYKIRQSYRPTDAPTRDIGSQNNRLTCIAVIDENDNTNVNKAWKNLRDAYPRRPFCLLRPLPTSGELNVPNGFDSDGNTVYKSVNRDEGDVDDASDWYEMCDLTSDLEDGVTSVALFVDNSGSMTIETVRASYDLFLSNANFNGFQVVRGDYLNDEDYFNPCLTSTASSEAPIDNPRTMPTDEPTYKPTRRPTRRPRDPTDKPTFSPSETPSGGEWARDGQIKGDEDGDQAGKAVAYTGDGKYVVVGIPNANDRSGQVRVYKTSKQDGWTQVGNDIDGTGVKEKLGNAVAISSSDKLVLVVGSPFYSNGDKNEGGRVSTFTLRNDRWESLGVIDGDTKGGNTGYAVAVSEDGQTMAVGSPKTDQLRPGVVHIYHYDNGWKPIGETLGGNQDGDLCGHSVAMSGDGSRVVFGCPAADTDVSRGGKVGVFEYNKNDDSWKPVGQVLEGPVVGAEAGTAVSVTNDGNTLAIGLPGMDGYGKRSAGVVQIYRYRSSNNRWVLVGDHIVGGGANYAIGQSVSLAKQDGSVVGFDGGPYIEGNTQVGGLVKIMAFNGRKWAPYGPSLQIDDVSNYYKVALSNDGTSLVVGYDTNKSRGIAASFGQSGFSAPTASPR